MFIYIYIIIIYTYSECVRNARENSWKATAATVSRIMCPAIYLYQSGKRIYADGVGGESDTHSCGGKLAFSSVPLAGSPVCPSHHRLEPSVLYGVPHTNTPPRRLVLYIIMSARYFLFVSVDVRTHTHTHMRFRNLFRLLYIHNIIIHT